MLPRSVRLEAATACQLRCPLCPTASGEIGRNLGTGFLRPETFLKFLSQNPQVEEIELSNWGEIFLNRELPEILKIAWHKKVALSVDNGANLNLVHPEALEAVVAYRLRSLNCSIDGTTQEVYAQYRRRGNLATVLANIREINRRKRRHRTRFPRLNWQFVVFDHNLHQLAEARQMAQELGMSFRHKISWEDFYGLSGGEKQQKVEEIRRALGHSDRQEFERDTGRHYLRSVCTQLWRNPQINFDGRLLGCCVNHWSDFGNVLQDGLETPRLAYAREMLQGNQPAREDIACTSCSVYASLQGKGNWLKPEEVASVPYSWKDRLRRQIHPDLWELLKDLKGLLRRCGFTFWP